MNTKTNTKAPREDNLPLAKFYAAISLVCFVSAFSFPETTKAVEAPVKSTPAKVVTVKAKAKAKPMTPKQDRANWISEAKRLCLDDARCVKDATTTPEDLH